MRANSSGAGPFLISIAILNGAVFLIVTLRIGGDAINGKIEGGRYFVANHGRLTEVSRQLWEYSRALAICTNITFPIGCIVGSGLIADAKRNQDE